MDMIEWGDLFFSFFYHGESVTVGILLVSSRVTARMIARVRVYPTTYKLDIPKTYDLVKADSPDALTTLEWNLFKEPHYNKPNISLKIESR